MPGLHARPAPPGLQQRPRGADRGSLGADDRRHTLGRLVHGGGGRRRRRELLRAGGRRRALLRRIRRPRRARVLHARALPQARGRRPHHRAPAGRALRALARGGHRRARVLGTRRARRSPRWPRSHAPRRPPARPTATTETPTDGFAVGAVGAMLRPQSPAWLKRSSSASSWACSSAGRRSNF